MKRTLIIFLIFSGSIMQASLSWPAEKLSFATTIKFNPILVLPALAAEEKGLWKERGLEAETTLFDADRVAYQAIAAGKLQAGIGGTSSLILGASRGSPAVIVADMQVIDYGFRLWVKKDAPYRQPRDLKGAKVGITSLGTLPHVYALTALRALGLDKDVRFIALGGVPSTVASFRAGHAEAVALSIFSMANLKARGEARELLNLVEYFPQPWSEIAVFVHKPMAKERPEAIRKMVQVVFMATDFVLKNRAWTKEKLQNFFRIQGDLDWIYERINYGKDGRIDPRALENVRNLLIENGLLSKEKASPLPELYAPGFAG